MLATLYALALLHGQAVWVDVGTFRSQAICEHMKHAYEEQYPQQELMCTTFRNI